MTDADGATAAGREEGGRRRGQRAGNVNANGVSAARAPFGVARNRRRNDGGDREETQERRGGGGLVVGLGYESGKICSSTVKIKLHWDARC